MFYPLRRWDICAIVLAPCFIMLGLNSAADAQVDPYYRPYTINGPVDEILGRAHEQAERKQGLLAKNWPRGDFHIVEARVFTDIPEKDLYEADLRSVIELCEHSWRYPPSAKPKVIAAALVIHPKVLKDYWIGIQHCGDGSKYDCANEGALFVPAEDLDATDKAVWKICELVCANAQLPPGSPEEVHIGMFLETAQPIKNYDGLNAVDREARHDKKMLFRLGISAQEP